MIICKLSIYVFCCYFHLITCYYCTRGFQERDRPFINVITNATLNHGGTIHPLWAQSKRGGNFIVDDRNRTGVVVPASGTYVIFVISQGISGSNLRVYRYQNNKQFLVVHRPLNAIGSTVCGSVSHLNVGDILTFSMNGGASSPNLKLQLFAYLLNLSVN